MVECLRWGPEDHWQHPSLRSVGALSLHVRAAADMVTGLRHRRLSSWRPVQPWDNPRSWEPGTMVYLSGPMTGHPDNNVPLFDKHAQLLREQG